MSNVLIGEFIGTMLLVLLGDGVCANVTLNNSGFKAAGPLFIALGGVFAVVFQQQQWVACRELPCILYRHLQLH